MLRRRFLHGALGANLASVPDERRRRVDEVRRTPGFVALWDFVKRDPTDPRHGRFAAHQAAGDKHDFRLDAVNYVRDYWEQGRPATYDDFPLLGRGPFGQAIQFRSESDPNFRPCLLVPRARLHNSGLDAKGPGRSVSMVVWLIRESGNHAVAGIWHEGTDLHAAAGTARKVERGKRQYALFAGLAGKSGAAAIHVSENGASSFGDKFARNLAVTPEVIPAVPTVSTPETLDHTWTAVGCSFDNARNTVTAYIGGKASEHWIEHPERHPFFQWPYKGWLQAQLQRMPGPQPDADPSFPKEQFYEPPEGKPLARTVIEERNGERVELHSFAFTRVRVTLRAGVATKRELVALKANPFWFGHDIYAPQNEADGGPFTIGRVIHSSRTVGFTGYIGGVAVFQRALSAEQMERLAAIGHDAPIALES